MDFFASQDAARRKSGVLIFYFALALLCIVLAVYAAFAAIFIGIEAKTGDASEASLQATDPRLFGGVASVTLLIVVLGTLYKIAQLRQGGDYVARSLGGRLLPPQTADFHEKRLLNVVGEMALASGVRPPPVYLLDDEKGINAFAAGYTPDDAVLGVTRGAIRTLTRDELQGVIAHEFSHLLNGDMRLNIRLMGLIHGLLVISIVGYYLFRTAGRSGGRKKGGAAALALFGLALAIIGYIGVFFGHLIKSAVSRQREYLADASAVQFTRNPQGISGALKKIGGLVFGSRIRSPQAESASHMFFGNGLRASWLNALATHPPLTDRIRRIEPTFDGAFPAVAELSGEEPAVAPRMPPPTPLERLQKIVPPVAMAVDPAAVLAAVGAPTASHVATARKLLESIPEEIRAMTRDTAMAQALLFGLLLDPEEGVRGRQLGLLAGSLSADLLGHVRRAAGLRERIPVNAYIAVIDVMVPALRGLDREAYVVFKGQVDALIEADRRVTLFEFALRRILLRHLESHILPQPPPRMRISSLPEIAAECSCVLSGLARAGNADEEGARQAFAQGAAALGPHKLLQYAPSRDGDLAAIDLALDRLAQAVPPLKRRLVAACLATLTVDNRITVREAELFRAIGDALDCPVPPWVVAEGGAGVRF
jgi:Zn-dependent protease with chaperone function